MKIGISLPVREMGNDVAAIVDFAQAAEELGLTHLRVPDQILRPRSGALQEPMMLLSFVAAVTKKIQLVPSVIILPSRQTVLFAKQAATLDVLSQGRVRIGIGVGSSADEYQSLGQDFHTRGDRCSEQIQIMRRLWSGEDGTNIDTRFDSLSAGKIDPLPVQQSIPLWIGGAGMLSNRVANRVGELADGWFVLCSPDQYSGIRDRIDNAARLVGRNPTDIGTEAGVAVVGARQHEWKDRVIDWKNRGLTHLCLRTLGGGLPMSEHVPTMQTAVSEMPVEWT